MIKLEWRKLVLSFIDFSTRLKQITSLKELLPPGVHIAKAALENGVHHPGKGEGGGGEGLEDLVVSRLNLPNSPIRLCNIWCSPQWQLIVSHLFIASLYSKFTTTDSSSVLSENHGISPKILPPPPAMNNFPYLQQKLLWLKSLSRLQSIRNINNPQHPPTAHAW